MSRTRAWNCFFAILFLVTSAYGYDVVLKNGKTVKGDLVSQDDTLIVLKDASGVTIQLKKTTVDLSKTEVANPRPATPDSVAASPAPADSKPKQPARKYTLQDLEQMREKHNLGESTAAADEPSADSTEAKEEKPEATAPSDAAAAKAAEENERKAAALRKKIDDTQKLYDELTKQCESLKTKNFQTDKLYDEKGNALPFFDTIKKTCDDADKAKAMIDQATEELRQLGQ